MTASLCALAITVRLSSISLCFSNLVPETSGNSRVQLALCKYTYNVCQNPLYSNFGFLTSRSVFFFSLHGNDLKKTNISITSLPKLSSVRLTGVSQNKSSTSIYKESALMSSRIRTLHLIIDKPLL